MLRKLEVAAAMVLGALLLQATPATAAKKAPNLLKVCKKECPEAKDIKGVLACVNKQEYAGGPESETFKKSKCFITHEAHEDEYRKMAGLGPEKDEDKEEHKKK